MSVPYREHDASHKIHDEWIAHRKEPYLFRKVRRKHNNRWNNYGELRKYRDGRVIYWAQRRFDEVYYELQGWAIDHATLRIMSMLKVTHIGVLVKATKQEYLVPFERFDFVRLPTIADALPVAKSKGVAFIDWSTHAGKKGLLGQKQWVLPLAEWEHEQVAPHDIAEVMSI